MTGQKYTPEGLPVITRDTYAGLLGDMLRPRSNKEAIKKYFDNGIERLKRDNPLLIKCINGTLETLAEEGASLTIRFVTAQSMIEMYELLRKQAESNNMLRDLKDKI